MIASRHWPIVNAAGEVVAPSCQLRVSVRLKDLPMASRVEDVTCRRCRSSQRYLDIVREQEEQAEAARAKREQRAILLLIERHREEFDELLTAEAILDVFGG
jgi:hypothetical protein